MIKLILLLGLIFLVTKTLGVQFMVILLMIGFVVFVISGLSAKRTQPRRSSGGRGKSFGSRNGERYNRSRWR